MIIEMPVPAIGGCIKRNIATVGFRVCATAIIVNTPGSARVAVELGIATITTDDEVILKLDGEPNPAVLSAEMRWVPQLDTTAHSKPRIGAIQGSSLVTKIKQNLLPKWQDHINLYDSIGPNGKLVITITAKAANKGEALRSACDHLGIAPEDVVSFGDAENDIEMFKITGASVAMGQAEDFIKAAATHNTLANTEHGVAASIHQLLDKGHL